MDAHPKRSRLTPLSELGEWFGGGTPSKGRAEFWQDGTVPWLSPKDMGPEVIASTQDHITEAAVAGSSVRRVPAGSVALVVRSGILERTLPIAVVPFEVTLNQDMKAILPRPDVDPRWVAWGLRSREQELLRRCRKSGTTVASLETKALLAEQLPIPPLAEQRRIVEVLEDHLSRLDAATTYLESAGARQARLVDRFLSAALTTLSSRRRPLGKLLSQPLINGRSVPTVDDGFPVLRLTALQQGRVDLAARKSGGWTAREAASFLVQHRDFLISRGNGSRRLVGLGGLVVTEPDPVAFPDTLIRIRTKADMVYPEFLALVWNGSDVRRQIEAAAKTTAGIFKINQKDVERVLLPVPTMAQQKSLAAEVSAFRDSVERLDRARAASVARTRTLRQALLGAAFSGELTR